MENDYSDLIMNGKIIITYETGYNNGVSIDYMASIDKYPHMLYAEEEIDPDRLDENGEFLPGMEDESRERLKAEIVKQATELGIPIEMLHFC